MEAIGDPRIALAFIAGAFCIGVVLIFVVLPFLAQISLATEALTLLVSGIGDYFGNTKLVWLGCFVFILVIVACCCLVVGLVGALITCTTANPSQICRFIGR
jgi:hypothetical protein